MHKWKIIFFLLAAAFNASAQDRAVIQDHVAVYRCMKDGVTNYSSKPLKGADCHAVHPPQPTEASNGGVSMQGILAIAKMTGACGILQSMSAFQASTKLEGGDAFLERFFSTEAARLGKSPEQYVTDCQSSIDAYDKLWKLAEEPAN